MAHPRQQQSSSPDLREFSGDGSAVTRFDAKKRAQRRVRQGATQDDSAPDDQAHSSSGPSPDFLAAFSHDLRTPLQAIFGYTELLQRELHGPLTDAQRRDVQAIQQSQQQLLGLIDQLQGSRQK
jgi:signal transduction histidine kinase